MSLTHADNFDIYGGSSALMLDGRYAQVSGAAIVADPDGVSVPDVVRFAIAGIVRRALATPTAVVGIGQRVWPSALPSDVDMRPSLFAWRNGSNAVLAEILLNTNGSLEVVAINNTNGQFYSVATTAGPVITANAWWHLEVMFNPATKDMEIRVEGVPKLTLDSTNFIHPFSASVTTQVSFSNRQNGIGAANAIYYKDYFIWDGLGSENTDFLGTCIVTEKDPDSDVTIGGWTPSTGTEAWPILDTDAPGETPYVAAATPPPLPMVVGMTGLPEDITSIKGVVTVVRAKKIDGGDGNMQVSLISNGDFSDGVDRPITAAMTYWEDVHEVDPDTGVAWTPSALDAATLQINRTV